MTIRWRTLGAALVFAITGVLDMAGTIDLRPIVEAFVGPQSVGAVMVGLSLVFTFFRLITSAPVWSKE